MKKFIALLLALVMTLALVACGSKAPEAPKADAPATDAVQDAVDAVVEEGVKPYIGIDLQLLQQLRRLHPQRYRLLHGREVSRLRLPDGRR